MRILITTDAWVPQVNGVVRHIQDLVLELENQNIEYRLVTPKDFPHSILISSSDQVRWIVQGKKCFQKIGEEFNPTHIHAMTEGSIGIQSRKYAMKKKIPFSSSFHSHWAYFLKKRYSVPQWITWKYLAWFHKSARITFIPTENLKKIFQEKTNHSNNVVLANAVNTTHFCLGKPSKNDASSEKKAVYVGRVAPEKNIEAFLSIDIPSLKKRVIGDGPSRKFLSQKYQEALFTGNKHGSQLIQEYQNADVFVFPSLSDTFGIVLIEALACGTPIAALPSPASKELAQFFPEHFFINSDLTKAIHSALQKTTKDVPPNIQKFSTQVLAKTFISSLK